MDFELSVRKQPSWVDKLETREELLHAVKSQVSLWSEGTHEGHLTDYMHGRRGLNSRPLRCVKHTCVAFLPQSQAN